MAIFKTKSELIWGLQKRTFLRGCARHAAWRGRGATDALVATVWPRSAVET